MVPNPYDPRLRTDLSANENAVLHFMSDCMHGDDLSLIDRYIADDYIQHTPGIGQGKQGLINYLEAIAWKRPGRKTWRPIHLFSAGDLVVLHKLLPHVVIADFVRFNDKGQFAEHWDVVQVLPEPDYDPMRLSTENFSRFRALFGIAE
jgi:predicted SnoaL-like aldol condensation-catalyzing enzyme